MRAGTDDVVRGILLDGGFCPAVMRAAGLPVASDDEIEEGDVERMVELHCMAIGIPYTGVAVVDERLALKIELLKAWELLFVDRADQIGLPPRIARVLKKIDEAAWQPLVWLIERGVWPIGPAPSLGAFVVTGPGLKPEPPEWSDA